MSNAAAAPPAPTFEKEPCSRCYGSGSFSYCQRYGTTCFRCGGKKETLTKRGAAAWAFYIASVTVPVGELRDGDVIYTSGMTAGGDSYATLGKIASISEPHVYGQSKSGDGPWADNVGITLTLVDPKTGAEVVRSTVEPKSSARKVWSAEVTAEKRAAALAYQATLTKAGAPRKALRAPEPDAPLYP